MDRVQRLIALLALCLWAIPAHAVYVQAGEKQWWAQGYPNNLFSSSGAAVEWYINTYSPGWISGSVTATNEAYVYYRIRHPSNAAAYADVRIDRGCSAASGTTAVAGKPACYVVRESCPTGHTLAGNTCEPPSCPSKGTVEGDSDNAVQSSGKSPGSSVCIGGCEWTGGGAVPSGCLNGKCYTFGPFTSTGGSCTGEGASGESTPAPETEAKCASKGMGSITINGTTTCVPNSNSESTKETSETKTDSGGTTKTSKKSTTKCEGSKCTTTTEETTTGSGGASSTKTTTTEEPKQDYCQKNPTALECKEEPESKWGGSCVGGFSCDGDAVQCAMAREQYSRNCALIDDKSSPVVQLATTATGAAMPTGHPGLTPIEFNVNSSSINQANPYGTACPDDIHFSVAGHQLNIPLSDICPYLRALGYTLVAVSLWVAFKTVSGAL